jgi:protein-disulfide isomerase
MSKEMSVATAQKQGGGSKWFYWMLGLVVLAGVGWLLTAGRSGGEAEELPPLSVAETTGIESDPGAGTAIGPENAVVTIYDFSDYLCPHCRDFNAMVGKLLRRNYAGPEGPLRWVSYEFPLGDRSFPATIAAHCAEEQGRYWEMHDMLYAKVESWATEANPNGKFADIAKEIGMDAGDFRECVEKREGVSRILASKQFGVELGVTGTPTIFVNGQPVPRTNQFYSYQGLEAFIKQQVAAAADNAAE